uniref:EF-hand domain-containing protein n=1 Tax=Alexandrium catenella TaxID=2925 RepID=A0A7S1SF58_ALECA|mmetsp:Transcript_98985/g.262965  ORF Transcript_98985/g.262965 Transcript_98985/m.262965 type:complete len:203 (+) Transcript_98985:77-685(+)
MAPCRASGLTAWWLTALALCSSCAALSVRTADVKAIASVESVQSNLTQIEGKCKTHYFIWNFMCVDKVRSCPPTKALFRKILDRLDKEKAMPAAATLAQDLVGYLSMMVHMKQSSSKLEDLWKAAPKNAKSEVDGWEALGIDGSRVPASAFATADSDGSGSLSEYEVIDFVHVCLEIGGATKGIILPAEFDPWEYGRFAGLA